MYRPARERERIVSCLRVTGASEPERVKLSETLLYRPFHVSRIFSLYPASSNSPIFPVLIPPQRERLSSDRKTFLFDSPCGREERVRARASGQSKYTPSGEIIRSFLFSFLVRRMMLRRGSREARRARLFARSGVIITRRL